MKEIEVVCAVIHNGEGKLLIGKRKSEIANGIWEFPGGKVERNETKEAACIREIQEELNVAIVIDGYITTIVDTAFTPVVRVFAYHAHIVKGNIQLHAHDEIKWVKPSDLYQYSFQKADQKLLDMLQEI